ncbi:MAG: FKBP-type peptidyl-prolyl cis-trans isomerase [Deltaproteobacteria bacterium]|nr:FKBP-type peptidyl-prolyl cis-trans isomerase [Deltaproteobacteria bacterium]
MTDADDVIKAGKRVELRYTLRDTNGRYLDDSGAGTESYVHGSGAVVRGLERALEGRRAGDRIEVTLTPDDAYGPRRRGPGPQPIPRGTFPADAELKVGMKFEAETPDGQPVDLYIARVDGREVHVDTNHPYAGMTLRYAIEVVAVRSA